jgi:hypothetical protein
MDFDEKDPKSAAKDYMVSLNMWCDKAPSDTSPDAFILPPYAAGSLSAQQIRPFLDELLNLALFAHDFDVTNNSAGTFRPKRADESDAPVMIDNVEFLFLRQYVLLEPDMATERGYNRWFNPLFDENDMGCVRHCPFIFICREGFVVVGDQKRGPARRSAVDAIVDWLQAMYRCECKGVLHTGFPMKIA